MTVIMRERVSSTNRCRVVRNALQRHAMFIVHGSMPGKGKNPQRQPVTCCRQGSLFDAATTSHAIAKPNRVSKTRQGSQLARVVVLRNNVSSSHASGAARLDAPSGCVATFPLALLCGLLLPFPCVDSTPQCGKKTETKCGAPTREWHDGRAATGSLPGHSADHAASSAAFATFMDAIRWIPHCSEAAQRRHSRSIIQRPRGGFGARHIRAHWG